MFHAHECMNSWSKHAPFEIRASFSEKRSPRKTKSENPCEIASNLRNQAADPVHSIHCASRFCSASTRPVRRYTKVLTYFSSRNVTRKVHLKKNPEVEKLNGNRPEIKFPIDCRRVFSIRIKVFLTCELFNILTL